jgi:hypothetical protein
MTRFFARCHPVIGVTATIVAVITSTIVALSPDHERCFGGAPTGRIRPLGLVSV